ncbi:serine hydrolase (FSH1) domain-containing protein [Hirsutella rhossiliensis]|uniref:Serine hydrolase (FSH1) domain-containing protein n=1 Tax=Hirsutella rhossiliensis TaxID=111463 RepID=A0A9P8SH32_9HYPO|nr:serine hydrolase (FSH1) domain-containing protein [Hirsutella rhossiliensis]KAH0960591.1 serine hydrolase (FSH1) domain-containing protein [Hirsutella rhossiliensis]
MECVAGPGVLPLFAGHEPYHCWFGGNDTTIEKSMKKIDASVKQAVDRWNKIKSNPEAEIVGGIGFSEGALALSMLLWQQQQGMVPWLSRLQFAVMSCCFFPGEASLWLNARAQDFGLSKAHINVPTLHIHGNRDFCLGRARRLVRAHYQPEYATVIQTEAGHHLPTKKEEVAEVVKHILSLSTTAPSIAVA